MDKDIASAVSFDDCDYSDAQELLYRGQPYTGTVVERGPHGQVIALQRFRHGIPDGLTRIWGHDGSLRSETDYAFGMSKSRRHWHPNGQLKSEVLYDGRGKVTSNGAWDDQGNPTDVPSP